MPTKPLAPDETRWDTLLRYRLLEIVALWEGRLTTRHLCASFNIGRQQASRDINEYLAIAPGNLQYDKYIKGYVPTADFTPRFTRGEADEYLHLLDRHQELGGMVEALPLPNSPVQVLRVPARHITPSLLRPLVQAARERRRAEVHYVSMTVPEGEDRVIAPHALVFTGTRWHVRAYCERNRDYRDFVLSRFRGAPELLDSSPNPASADAGWNAEVALRIGPNPGLSTVQQKVIAEDWNMRDHEVSYTVRACLAQYILDLMQVSTEGWTERPLEHPLVLLNAGTLNKQLWKSTQRLTVLE